jgi:hypothetical protein
MSPWKRQRLRAVWNCGVRPRCEHRHWIFAWIHGLLWRARRTEKPIAEKPRPPAELTRADVDEFTRRVGGRRHNGGRS